MLLKLEHILYIFFISMVPVIELRGAIPIGAALDLPWYLNMTVSVLGNLLPVPFILLFIRRVLAWLETHGYFLGFVNFLNQKVRKHTDKVLKYAKWGLFVFVAIPLPGTGAWTGALVAAFLDMRMRSTFPAIAGGVLCAAGIMTAASYGVAGVLQYLL